MRGENPEKITNIELWNDVFEDYESKGSALKRIFDPNSDYNKRLVEFAERCTELIPDFDDELRKLGFDTKIVDQYPNYFTPNYVEYYYNDKEDVITVSRAGIMVVTYNDQEESFESDIIGEEERMALKWITKMVEVDMTQNEINEECYELILGLNNLCSNLVTDVTTAAYFGLKDYNFSEEDLEDLEKIYDKFWKVFDEIPDFENVVRFNEPIGLDRRYEELSKGDK